jgi:hypothetical protein
MASRLRAWIFPLEYEPIQNPLDERKLLGAMTSEGEFCLDPTISEYELEYVMQEQGDAFDDLQREAVQRFNRRINHTWQDKHFMNGRTVILTGDILFGQLEIELAKMLLKPIKPAKLLGVAGNVTVDVSDKLHVETSDIEVLDVLPNATFDDDHFFEKADAYSADEKWALAQNIYNYWA